MRTFRYQTSLTHTFPTRRTWCATTRRRQNARTCPSSRRTRAIPVVASSRRPPTRALAFLPKNRRTPSRGVMCLVGSRPKTLPRDRLGKIEIENVFFIFGFKPWSLIWPLFTDDTRRRYSVGGEPLKSYTLLAVKIPLPHWRCCPPFCEHEKEKFRICNMIIIYVILNVLSVKYLTYIFYVHKIIYTIFVLYDSVYINTSNIWNNIGLSQDEEPKPTLRHRTHHGRSCEGEQEEALEPPPLEKKRFTSQI